MPYINVKLNNGRAIFVEMYSNENIYNLKKKIEEKIDIIPERQKLLFNGRILENTEIIGNSGISKGPNIHLEIIGIQHVKFKTSDGKIYNIKISCELNIIDAKEFIEKTIGISAIEQIWMYNNIVLNNCMTLDEYRIEANNTISVVKRIKKINVLVTTADSRSVSLEVTNDENFRSLKRKVEESLELEDSELVLDEIILADDDTMAKFEIKDDTIIKARRCQVNMPVRMVDGKVVLVKVLRTDKVVDINMKIENATGILRNEQILIYKKRILYDYETIDIDYESDIKEINVIPQKSDILIFVLAMDGRKCSINVKTIDKIIILKNKIQQELGIEPDKQILVFLGQILTEECSCIERNIYDHSTVYVVDG